MDIQLKKGLLELCLLRILCGEASYGYKIIGDLSQVIEISESTLYPILRRLESSGCLTTFMQEYNSRLRKYYQITDIGRQRVKYFETEWQQLKRIYEFILQEGTSVC